MSADSTTVPAAQKHCAIHETENMSRLLWLRIDLLELAANGK
jgi:hypothetical protein